MPLDRNAKDDLRQRRNAQRTRRGDGTSDITVIEPITNSSGLGLHLSTVGGLQISTGLTLKLVDASLVLAAGGVGVKLATVSGLMISGGLAIQPSDTSLFVNGSGVKVSLSGTSLAIDVVGVKVNPADSSLAVASGLAVQLADSSLITASGVKVQLATNGGLELNTGVQVKGWKVVASDPGSPADGEAWYNTTTKIPYFEEVGTKHSFVGKVFANIADGTPIVSTVGPSTFDTTFTFPANFFTAGKSVRIRTTWIYSTTGTPTLTVTSRIGTKTIVSNANAPTVAATNRRLYLDVVITCRTTGATGTFGRTGAVFFEQTAGASAFLTPAGGATITAVDTTGTLVIDHTATWSASSASNTVTLLDEVIEVLN